MVVTRLGGGIAGCVHIDRNFHFRDFSASQDFILPD